VLPIRAVISREPASHLRKARERQGVDIGALKRDHATPAEEGIVRRYGA
jgi:hypothetical protein